MSNATSYSIWEEAEERSFLVPSNKILVRCDYWTRVVISPSGLYVLHRNSRIIWCVAQSIPYSEGGDVNTLTGLFFFLRNIYTLWWRFLTMRFLFWTQIWWCHSRQGHLQECLTWWLNRLRGKCVFPPSVPALAGCGVTSISSLTLQLIF